MSIMENNITVNLLSQGLIDAGELRITVTTLGRKIPGKRYLIYLPMNRNYIWEVLHEKNVKVRVFIEIPSEALRNEAGGKREEN
jgi:hypothetical protein